MSTDSVSFRYLILGLLNQQPLSGYDIKRLLKRWSWLVDGPSFGNIYSTLHSLLNEGLVTVNVVPHENKPPRKVYSIVEAGRQVLQEWASQSVGSRTSLKAFVMRLILADNFSRGRLIAHLEHRRAQVATHYDAMAKTAGSLDAGADPHCLALDYGLAFAATELAWLENTVNRLSQQPLIVESVQST